MSGEVSGPRVLRTPVWAYALGGLELAAGLAAIGWGLIAHNQLFFWMGLLLTALFGWIVGAAVPAATVLEGDAIVSRGLFSTRRIKRADIVGYRALRSQYNSYAGVELLCRDGHRIKVLSFGSPDVETWLASVPNIEDVERAQSSAALASDPMLGATPAVRKAAIARMKGLQYGLYGFAGVVWMCLLFLRPAIPWPSVLAGLSPLAAVVIVVVTQRRMRLLSGGTDARPHVAGLFWAASALGFSAIGEIQYFVVDKAWILGASALVAVAACGACWNIDPNSMTRGPDGRAPNFGNVLALFVALFAWSAGGIVWFDIRADHAPARIFRSTIASERVIRGRGAGYYVDIGPWEPYPKGNEVESLPLYRVLRVGDPICLRLHPGALRLRWFQADACLQG